jgi:hypothetical protein
MPNPTYFLQPCPTCGRRLQIRVEYLGKRLVCQHCQGEFEAVDPTNNRYDCAGHQNSLLRRADELLETVAQRRAQCRSPHPK